MRRAFPSHSQLSILFKDCATTAQRLSFPSKAISFPHSGFPTRPSAEGRTSPAQHTWGARSLLPSAPSRLCCLPHGCSSLPIPPWAGPGSFTCRTALLSRDLLVSRTALVADDSATRHTRVRGEASLPLTHRQPSLQEEWSPRVSKGNGILLSEETIC